MNTTTSETESRRFLTPQQRRMVEDWLTNIGQVEIDRLAEKMPSGTYAESIAYYASDRLGFVVTASNLQTCAKAVEIRIPTRAPGRPRAVEIASSESGGLRDDLALVCRELVRLLKVLELQPADADGLNRVAGG